MNLPKPDLLIPFSIAPLGGGGFFADPFLHPSNDNIVFVEMFRSNPRSKSIAALEINEGSVSFSREIIAHPGIEYAFPFPLSYDAATLLAPSTTDTRGQPLFEYEEKGARLVHRLPFAGVDPVLVHYGGDFVALIGKQTRHERMRCFVARNLEDQWQQVPLRVPLGVRRMGGYPRIVDGELRVYCQVYFRHYGYSVAEHKLAITDKGAVIRRVPFGGRLCADKNNDWNSNGMHTICTRSTRSVADGKSQNQRHPWTVAVWDEDIACVRMPAREPLFQCTVQTLH